MELNKIEKQILTDIYDVDLSLGMPFEIQNYILTESDPKEKKQEFAYYLARLKELGFIKYEEAEAFINSGIHSIKYNNNVDVIYGDKIHIDSKGIKLVEEMFTVH